MAVGNTFTIDQLTYTVLTESGTTGTVEVTHKDNSITGDIVIPETVTNNGITYTVTQLYNTSSGGAFNYAANITSLYIPKTVISTTNGSWFNICVNATKLRSINIDPENPSYTSIDGVVYNKDITMIYRYPNNKLDPTFRLPETVKKIQNASMRSAKFKYINDINVENVSNAIFQDSSLIKCNIKVKDVLEGISLFSGCTYLKHANFNKYWLTNAAFKSCTSLREITLGPSIGKSTSYTAFNDTLNIQTVNVDSQYVVDHFKDFFPQITSSTSPLRYVNIGDSVKSISGTPFSDGVSLREVNIGKNVTNISGNVFANCENLYYLNFNPINLTYAGTYYQHVPCYEHVYSRNITSSYFNAVSTFVKVIKCEPNPNILTASVTWNGFIRKINVINFYNCNRFSLNNCSNIKSITLPNSITNINNISNVSKLVSVVFEGNAPTTSSATYSGSMNTNLKTYYYQDTIGWESTFAGKPTQKVFRGEVTVGNYTYKFVDGINGTPNVSVRAANDVKLSGVLDVPQTVTIDDVVYTVRYVADNGFENQYNITSFDMHNQYLEIGNNAFKGCRNLTTVSNTNGITDIGEGAFNGCSNLTSFSIQTISNVYHPIEKNTFKDCKSLISITLSDYTYDICESAFENCTSLTSINIPNECNHIYENAFKNCKSLQTVTYGTNLYIIHDEAFLNCRNLQSITPSSTNNLETLKDKVFYNCYALTSAPVTSIRDIGKYCFYNCKGLTSLTLPDTTDYVDDCAFGYCNNLTTFTNNTPDNAEFGNDVFVGTDIIL